LVGDLSQEPPGTTFIAPGHLQQFSTGLDLLHQLYIQTPDYHPVQHTITEYQPITAVGSQSYQASATTKFDAPKGVDATAASESSITISWNAVSASDNVTIYYYIYRSDSSSGTYTQVGTSTTTSYINNGLSSDTTYYYKVAVYTGGQTGIQSDYVSATTKLGAPTGVTATGGSRSITVSWNAVSNTAGYCIYRSNSSSGTYTDVGTSTTTSYTNTGLSSGTYYYKVTAYNSNGESDQSTYAYASTY